MAGNVWVLAEQWRGQLSDVTFELLVLGRELATTVGGPLQAVLLGQQPAPQAQKTERRNNRHQSHNEPRPLPENRAYCPYGV
jgi:electron transfer flavoprotein alpha subunit